MSEFWGLGCKLRLIIIIFEKRVKRVKLNVAGVCFQVVMINMASLCTFYAPFVLVKYMFGGVPMLRASDYQFSTHRPTPYNQTRCLSAERFASAWPELIIACDVRGRGKWLHRCSWSPQQLACAAYRLFAHAFRLQTYRQTEGQTSQPCYICRLSPLKAAGAKNKWSQTLRRLSSK